MRVAIFALLVAGAVSAQSTIDGAVINSVTRAGIEGVSVRFYTQKGVRYEASTLSDGSFHIAGVGPGDYRHSLEKDGFEPPPSPEFPSPESTMSVNGKDPVHITLEMTAWTTLRGRVVDAEGKPAAGVPVRIRGSSPPRDDVHSAADGSFEFGRLPPGAYTLVALPEPAKTSPAEGIRTEAVATYYPSSLDPTQAQPIAARGIGDESGFEIHLRRVPVYRVRGTVFDEADKPARSITVSISPAHPAPSSRFVTSLGRTEYYLPGFPAEPLITNVVTADDGTFEFPSVPTGDWIIAANSEWRYEEASRRDIQQTGHAAALVTRSDAEGVEIRLFSNFEFAASAIWPADTPSAARWAMVTLLPESGGLEQASFGMMKPDGAIQFERVYPGRYIVAAVANGTTSTYVSAVLFGGRDVLGQAIDLAPSPPPMQIVYKTGAGIVRAQFEKDASGIFVLIPLTPEGGYPRSVPCDATGSCQFAGLRPGDYLAAAFDRVDGVKLSNPAYVTSLVPLATRIRVDENSNQLLSLPVSHWPD